MNRKQFIYGALVSIPTIGIAMKYNAIKELTKLPKTEDKMPVLFLGHGSPMNAIEENEFVQGFRKVSTEIEKPKAIICVSAHWETNGTKVTAMESPRTIHDFGGFPQELFDVQYPAPGNPELAKQTKEIITSTEVGLDDKWGLDHGAWSVIKHLYPDADVPVIQLSLNVNKTPKEHYELAKELSSLREKGVLIVGSGNIVHNLGRVAWDKLNENYAYDWAKEAGEKINEYILNGNMDKLIDYSKNGNAFNLAIPTSEHYLPLLYTLALQQKEEEINLFNDKFLAGSLSMTSLKIG